MSGFLITEVNHKKKETDIKATEELKIDNEIDPNNKKSAFLVKNTKEFGETTSKMLDYMVEDQTDFADLMKIEEFLKNQTIEYCEEVNINKHDLVNKSDYLSKISLEIEEVKKIIKIRNF